MSRSLIPILVTPPCKGCGRREVGCHGGCEQYQEYRAKVQAKRREIAQDKTIGYTVESDGKLRMAEFNFKHNRR